MTTALAILFGIAFLELVILLDLQQDVVRIRDVSREALRMLQAEGLVVSERNRGAMVRPLSSTEVEDLYGLRIRLESYAVELATERSTETELGAMVEAADAFNAAAAAWDAGSVDSTRRLHEANRRFHDGILEAARHRRLTTMLARTVDIPLVFRAFQSFGATEIERFPDGDILLKL